MKKVELKEFLFRVLSDYFQSFELISFEHTDGHKKYDYTAKVRVYMGAESSVDTFYVRYERRQGVERVIVLNENEVIETFLL